MADFYDELAPFYHLLFPNWEASSRRRDEQWAALMRQRWPSTRTVLDLACGIGTQALGLARQGFDVTASDLSAGAVARARREAQQRGLAVDWSVADLLQAHAHHGGGFDLVLCADNSLPHLLSDQALLQGLQQMFACTRPGGGCVITVRDYAREPRDPGQVRAYPAHERDGQRWVLSQTWRFDGDVYDLLFDIEQTDLATGRVSRRQFRSRYRAIGTPALCSLMRQAGWGEVERLDGVFYQPVLVGTRMPG